MQMVLNDNFVLTYIDTLLGEKKTVSSTTLCAQNAISNKKNYPVIDRNWAAYEN